MKISLRFFRFFFQAEKEKERDLMLFTYVALKIIE